MQYINDNMSSFYESYLKAYDAAREAEAEEEAARVFNGDKPSNASHDLRECVDRIKDVMTSLKEVGAILSNEESRQEDRAASAKDCAETILPALEHISCKIKATYKEIDPMPAMSYAHNRLATQYKREVQKAATGNEPLHLLMLRDFIEKNSDKKESSSKKLKSNVVSPPTAAGAKKKVNKAATKQQHDALGGAKKAEKPAATRKSDTTSSMLKDAAEGFVPKDDYASFTQDKAVALNKWMETSLLIRRDASDANKRCWQVRCITVDNKRERLRVLIVTGSTTFFALAKYIAEALGWTPDGKEFDPQPSKGVIPAGSYWTVEKEERGTNMGGIIGTQKNVFKAAGKGAPFFDEKKVKLYQVLRNRGDTITYYCNENRKVVVRLDGFQKTPDYYKGRYTPKLVGADDFLSKWNWTNLNAIFLQNKPAETVLFSRNTTEEERDESIANMYKVPLFDHRGNAMDEKRQNIAEMHRLVALPFHE